MNIEVKSSGTSSVWTSFMLIVDKDNKKSKRS